MIGAHLQLHQRTANAGALQPQVAQNVAEVGRVHLGELVFQPHQADGSLLCWQLEPLHYRAEQLHHGRARRAHDGRAQEVHHARLRGVVVLEPVTVVVLRLLVYAHRVLQGRDLQSGQLDPARPCQVLHRGSERVLQLLLHQVQLVRALHDARPQRLARAVGLQLCVPHALRRQ
eukprot:1179976-Prorocentrum_minimum.AAC.5